VIDPPAHPKSPNPLPEAPPQAPGKANKQGELKGNQKQKYRPIGQNFKQTKKQQTPQTMRLAVYLVKVRGLRGLNSIEDA